MIVTLQSLIGYGLAQGAEVFNAGFSGYFVPVKMTAESLLTAARVDGVDLLQSRVIVRNGEPVGMALIARRGWSSRLAGMAIRPEHRGSGIGSVALALLVAEARARGDRTMVLEVIEQNGPAVRLYEKAGFTRVRRLVGFNGVPAASATAQADADLLVATDPREFALGLAADSFDLPWQLSAETLAHATPPAIALRLGSATLLMNDPSADIIALRGLHTVPTERRRGAATRLLHAAGARFAGKAWRVSVVWPEELCGLFGALGLTRDPLTQWQMRMAL